MSDLTFPERRKLEELLEMGSGYVLKFSDRTFAEFFDVALRKDIYGGRYNTKGTSKANHLRSFWDQEPNSMVATCLRAMVSHAVELDWLDADPKLLSDCQGIITRLALDQPVAELDAILVPSDERDFEALATAVRECIEKNQPEAGLDRLHTFVVKFIRSLCDKHGLELDRSVPLHGLMGSYVKRLREKGAVRSDMAERILKSSIQIMESFNHVRNNHSLAHDNQVLGYEEALLIFNHVASTIRFIRSVETQLKSEAEATAQTAWDSDIPF